MSSIEHLKEQARGFEQDEKWEKALDIYSLAIDQLADDDTPDIALFNRSGDLATKVGSNAQALGFYERAGDYYMDAGLPNNAIAVCKKVMRNLPDRHTIHLKMGQIRAAQGFITDARTSFVTYAGRVQAAGDLDEAFRALIEFVNLAPDDHEICMMLAGQLEQNGRPDEAIAQYIGAYRILRRQGLHTVAEDVAGQIRGLDPNLDLEEAASDEVFEGGAGATARVGGSEGSRSSDSRDDVEVSPVDLPLMSFDDDEDDVDDAATPEPTAAPPTDQEEASPEPVAAPSVEEEEEAPEPLPTISVEEEEEISEPPATLPIETAADLVPELDPVALTSERDDDGLFTLDVSDDAVEPGSEDIGADVGDTETEETPLEAFASALEEHAAADESPPEVFPGALDADTATESPMDALSTAVEEAASARAAAEAAEQAVADVAATAADEAPAASDRKPEDSLAPAAPTKEFVDIGAMLLGGDEESESKSTRFVVPYEEPTGDDQADFEKMLAQFREKVSENIDPGNATAHYDLGTAYMEMGLLDEAISEYQMVLRGSPDHLATYEMLGQTFLQKEEPDAAIRSLNRVLEVSGEVEEELVGIYYYLGLAHETMGSKDAAMEFYDRVFALYINFADVTERLRDLRN